ncbi:MAG: HEAT repeat domain-containing protein [Cyclobacteriaceae bacterium]
MEKVRIEELIPDYLEGSLSENDRQEFEKALPLYPDLQEEVDQLMSVSEGLTSTPDLAPSHASKMRFRQALMEEKMAMPKDTRTTNPWAYQIAAGFALLVCGIAIGLLINRPADNSTQLLAMQQELSETKSLVLQSALKNHSASDRIRAVSLTGNISQPNAELIGTLVKTLNTDESPNVRLAAAEALAQYGDNDLVRASLVRSLSYQEDPIIQVTLIQMMVRLDEKSALKQLKALSNDEDIQAVVRQSAQTAIQILI